MKLTLRRNDENRGWPNYILGGRLRASTAGLILAFIALFWVNQNYQPDPPAAAVDPAQQVVPPGFVPDPNYTWVPRTNVRPREPEYTTPRTTTPITTTTTTITPTTPTTTSPGEPTTTSPGQPVLPFGPTTTVMDPDGPGPQGSQTFTEGPSAPPSTTAAAPPSTPTATQSWP